MSESDELRRLALGVLLPGFAGTTEPPEWVRRSLGDGLGGVIMFGRNVRSDEQVAALSEQLRQYADDPVIGIDEEGGDVTRLDVGHGSSVPGNNALGAADDVDLTRDVAAALGARLAGCGITLDLAPCADLTLSALDPIIGVRSFGADPALAARHIGAFVTGMQSAGVATCVKHFPGHGAASEDSHHALPVLPRTPEQLRAVELAPFAAAVAAGARSIMTGHLVVPDWGDEPATLNATALGVLRDELGFAGTVVTDALDMGAVADTAGMSGGAVRALLVGADALCVGGTFTDEATVERFVESIVAAVRSGELPRERLAEAVRRTAALGAPAPRPTGYDTEVGARAARLGLVQHGSLALSGDPLVVQTVVPASIAVGSVPWDLGGRLTELLPGVEVRDIGPDQAAAVSAPTDRPLVVVTRDARLRPWVVDLLTRLAAERPDLIWVETGVPGPDLAIANRLETHSGSAVSLRAAAERLAEARLTPSGKDA
jgi:beta-N-acetylhexosaminidase